MRVPGAWDGFELAVRAILGQQISVRGATTSPDASRCDAARRSRPERARPAVSHPGALADAPLEEAGIVSARATRSARSRDAVIDGTIVVRRRRDADALARDPGIGDWTAQYIAMRALGEPDAFPTGDLSCAAWLATAAPASSISARERGGHGARMR